MSSERTSYTDLLGKASLVAPLVVPASFVIYYSWGDSNVALAISRSISIANLILGVAVAVVPVWIMIFSTAFWANVILPPSKIGDSLPSKLERNIEELPFLVRLLGVFALPVIVMVWPTPFSWLLLGILAVEVVTFLISRRRLRRAGMMEGGYLAEKAPDNTLTRNRVYSLLPVNLFFLTIAIGVNASWVPLEEVSLSDGEVVVGRILEVDESGATVLTAPGEVRIIKSDELSSRKVCSIRNFSDLTEPNC